MNKLTLSMVEASARQDARVWLLTHHRPQTLTADAQVFYGHLARQQGKALVPAGAGQFEIH